MIRYKPKKVCTWWILYQVLTPKLDSSIKLIVSDTIRRNIDMVWTWWVPKKTLNTSPNLYHIKSFEKDTMEPKPETYTSSSHLDNKHPGVCVFNHLVEEIGRGETIRGCERLDVFGKRERNTILVTPKRVSKSVDTVSGGNTETETSFGHFLLFFFVIVCPLNKETPNEEVQNWEKFLSGLVQMKSLRNH